MSYRFCCLLIAAAVVVPLAAVAGEEGGASGETLTIEQKVERAHELLEQARAGSKHEVLKVIHEVGVANFLKPVLDDEEKLIYVVDGVMLGASTVEGSMTRADIGTYLLKDERPGVVRTAVKYVTSYALYCDKPYVGKVLFELYNGATDDADLRVALAAAICRAGSPDREGKEPRPFTHDDVLEALDRVPTLLKDPDPRVRRAAVENLIRAVSIMHRVRLGVLEEDPDPGVRAAVLDYYREAKVKTQRVSGLAIEGLGSSDLHELETAFQYCREMKLDEAREAMLGAVKRHAAPTGDDEAKARIERLKSRIFDMAINREWKEAAPDLLWIAENDRDTGLQTRAAYTMLTLLGQTTVSLGTAEEVFPRTVLEVERGPLMKAFKAWVIESYEGSGVTPEVKRLREEAQIEFSDKVYEIATERILNREAGSIPRGIRLVVEMGPEDFARQVETAQEAQAILGALVQFQRTSPQVELGRQIARMTLGFVDHKDPAIRKYALATLGFMVAYCDKAVFIPVLSKLTSDPDPQVADVARQLVAAIEMQGYAPGREQDLRYREGPAEPDNN